MSSETGSPEVLIIFAPTTEEVSGLIRQTFKGEEILRSSAFGGAETVTIITASVSVISAIFSFYKAYRASLKHTKIKIGKSEVLLEGFSAQEIDEMAEKGSIRKLQEKMNSHE